MLSFLNKKIQDIFIFEDGKKININDFIFLPKKHYKIQNKQFLLLKNLDFLIIWKEKNEIHTFSFSLDEGFFWDGASIPKYFQFYIGKPLENKFALASLFHDKLVEFDISHYIESKSFYLILISRKHYKLNKTKIFLMYFSVYFWSIYKNILEYTNEKIKSYL